MSSSGVERWPFVGKVAEQHLSEGVWLRDAPAAFCSGYNQEVLELDLLNRLRIGSLVALGSPGHAGADFEWIPTRSWFFLEPDPKGPNVVRGEGIVYFYVRVVDQMVLLKRDGVSAEPEPIGKPGPKSTKRRDVAKRIKTDILTGRVQPEELQTDLKRWEGSYAVTRNTFCRARDEALARIARDGSWAIENNTNLEKLTPGK